MERKQNVSGEIGTRVTSYKIRLFKTLFNEDFFLFTLAACIVCGGVTAQENFEPG